MNRIQKVQSVGFVTIMGREMATSQHFANWICEEALDSRFLMFAFMRSRDELILSGEGTTVRTIYMPALRQIQICIPPLAEQRRIVLKIDSLRERSSHAKRAVSEVRPLLEKFRQSLLQAAFSGRLTADWRAEHPDVEPATELLSRLRTERRHRWEESELAKYEAKGKEPPKDWQHKYTEPQPVDASELPQRPDGWCWASFKEVASIASNLVSPADYPDHPHVAPDNIEKETGRLLEYRTISEDGVTSNNNHFFRGQILYSKIRPYLSKVIVADFEGLCSADMYPISTPIELHYLFRYMLSTFFLEAVQQEAGSRVVLPKVNQKQLYSVAVPIAPMAEQAEIARRINETTESYTDIADVIAESDSALAQLHESILAKAFRGELVPRDPRDDPIRSSINEVIKTREERASQPPTRRSPVTKPAPASEQLMLWLAKVTRKSFSFDDLRADIRVNYDELRDAIFDLLTDKRSGFEQYFDEAERAMRFRKTAK